jgi:subtilisin family serine protease
MRPTASIVLSAVVFALSAPFAAAADRIPNDTYFGEQWYLRQISAPEAWNVSLGLETVPVAVIDSGVDIDHPDLKDNIWRNPGEVGGDRVDNDGNGYVDDVNGWDFRGNDNDPRPDIAGDYTKLGASHGTINAGIIAARGDNGIGVVGVTWQATVMPIRVLDSNGVGDPLGIVRAVEYAVRNGAKVINLSFAGTTKNDALAAALRRAYDAGVFVVAAAGNAADGGQPIDLDRDPLYPICLDQDAGENFIYGVAATDGDDRRAVFSNFGAGCIDISAPGTRIISTQLYRPGHKDFSAPYGGLYNGTSVAAPMVSGLVALIRSLDRNLTPKQVMNLLTESAFRLDQTNPEFFGKLGRGRIDAAKAVAVVRAVRETAPQAVTTASLLPPGAKGLYVVAPGPGRGPEVRLFTDVGVFVRGFEAFPSGFRGGVSLAAGDFDGNGKRSIVAGAMGGGAPQVRIFNRNTQPIGGFLAYHPDFRGGISVAAADLDGDGRDEIVTGAGPGGGPHVRLFTAAGTAVGGFFAFENAFKGGVSVAAADLDGDGRAEIIASRGNGGTTVVRVYDARGVMRSEFAPFGSDYRRGAAVRVRDVDGDGRAEIIVERSVLGSKEALVVNAAGQRLLSFDREKSSLLGYAAASGPASAPVAAALLVGSVRGAAPTITSFASPSPAPLRFSAYESGFKGGVSVEMIE